MSYILAMPHPWACGITEVWATHGGMRSLSLVNNIYPNLKYCTLNVSEIELRKQTDYQITRWPWQTFQAMIIQKYTCNLLFQKHKYITCHR